MPFLWIDHFKTYVEPIPNKVCHTDEFFIRRNYDTAGNHADLLNFLYFFVSFYRIKMQMTIWRWTKPICKSIKKYILYYKMFVTYYISLKRIDFKYEIVFILSPHSVYVQTIDYFLQYNSQFSPTLIVLWLILLQNSHEKH